MSGSLRNWITEFSRLSGYSEIGTLYVPQPVTNVKLSSLLINQTINGLVMNIEKYHSFDCTRSGAHFTIVNTFFPRYVPYFLTFRHMSL